MSFTTSGSNWSWGSVEVEDGGTTANVPVARCASALFGAGLATTREAAPRVRKYRNECIIC